VTGEFLHEGDGQFLSAFMYGLCIHKIIRTRSMAFKKLISIAIPLITAASISTTAHADLSDGDYSAVQTLWNITHPQAANNPVDAQLKAEMPFMEFIGNDAADDGFNPKTYHVWQTITLSADQKEHGEGAVKCANGDDYKFMVKRSPSSPNMVIFFEGGGGCWDYNSCSRTSGGQTESGLVGQGNDLPTDVALRAGSQSSLFTTVLRPNYAPKTKNWTKVYLPYCTQDLGVGNIVNNYLSDDGSSTFKINQRGITVQGAVLTWLKANLEQPSQMLLTGQSAGGFASELLYHTYRTALQPEQGYLVNDAGPIMWAPQSDDLWDGVDYEYPSARAHQKVTQAWNAEALVNWMENESNGLAADQRFDLTNMGTISNFLSARWPEDRFALITSQKDNTISGFSYNSFYPEGQYEDPEARDAWRDEKRLKEIALKRDQLDQLDNYGYHLPGYRPVLGGHVLTVPLIEDSTTNEDDGNNVFDLVSSVLNDSGRVMASWEGEIGLNMDINGRYDDCANEYFRISGSGMSAGDVYGIHEGYEDMGVIDYAEVLPCLENTHIDPNSEYPIAMSVLPWLTSDVVGIEALGSLTDSEDLFTQQVISLDNITVQDAAAIAQANIADAISIGQAEKDRIEAEAKAAAEAAAAEAARIAAAAKAAAEAEAGRIAAAAEAAAAEAARIAAEAKAAAKAAADAAAALAKKLCGRWCR